MKKCVACDDPIDNRDLRVAIDKEDWHWRCVVRLASERLKQLRG